MRLPDGAKLIVGRNKEDNEKLIVTYARTEADKVYKVDFTEYILEGVKFPSKEILQKYFI